MVLVELVEAHAVLFGMLGRLHREPPDDAALTRLGEVLDDWPLPLSDDSSRGLDHWRRSRTLGETAESIERDHDRLYGVSAVAVVPPYESVHREEEGLVFGATTLQVRADYRRLGLRVPDPSQGPDDHIGLEFDFMSQALLRAVECSDKGDEPGAAAALEASRDFLDDHLLGWAPPVLARVAEEARTEFMAGLAVLSIAVLDSVQALPGLADPVSS